MKKAKVLLDLPNDRGRIKGTWVELITSHCEHYRLNLLPKSNSMAVFEGLVAQENEEDEHGEEETGEDGWDK